MRIYFLTLLSFILIGKSSAQVQSEQSLPESSSTSTSVSSKEDDVIYVIGSKEKVFYTPGSAYFIEQKDLEKFNYQDVNRILDKVPGVYIQEEDGIGLRPNIGLRGAHPHRSKKVTLMEDGILVGPAPYSAPAAYYFPSTSRIGAMEVFKGPSSVKYGPNSIGGAINMVTPQIKNQKNKNKVSYEGGLIHSATLSHQSYSQTDGFLVQGNYKQGKSFKVIQGKDRPEIQQNDFLLKYEKRLPKKRKITLKLSHATEDSEETYLGLSRNDFQSTPYQRYSASELDRMQWDRQAIMLGWESPLFGNNKYNIRFYHHQMNRTWNKFSRFQNNQDLDDVFYGSDPDDLGSILSGGRNSLNPNENLIVGKNERSYFSQGVQSNIEIPLAIGSVFHQIDLGVRFHQDQVKRDHSELGMAMNTGDLIEVEDSYQVTNRNQDTSKAISTYIEDEIIVGDLSTKFGIRFERIESERDPRRSDLKENPVIVESQDVVSPGLGFNYSLNKNLAVLAGVNRGHTIVTPGQDTSIGPEESMNYEAGFRLKAPLYFEMIGFVSDYSNIKGTCSFSSGCGEELIDQEFNGGEALIRGVEVVAAKDIRLGSFIFPFNLNYTLTEAKFRKNSLSDNPEWGLGQIRSGDPLPYISQHSVNLGAGVQYSKYELNLNFLWKSQMADQSVAENRKLIPAYGVIDTSFKYSHDQSTNLFFKVKNVLDNTYVVSYRPFGIRPGAPRLFQAGFQYLF